GEGGNGGEPKVARKGNWVLAPTNEKHKFRLRTKEIRLELARGPWKLGDDPRSADVSYLLEALDKTGKKLAERKGSAPKGRLVEHVPLDTVNAKLYLGAQSASEAKEGLILEIGHKMAPASEPVLGERRRLRKSYGLRGALPIEEDELSPEGWLDYLVS